MRQAACLVFNPSMVDNYAALFNCTPVDRASDAMMALVCCLAHRGSSRVFVLLRVSASYSAPMDRHRRAAY